MPVEAGSSSRQTRRQVSSVCTYRMYTYGISIQKRVRERNGEDGKIIIDVVFGSLSFFSITLNRELFPTKRSLILATTNMLVGKLCNFVVPSDLCVSTFSVLVMEILMGVRSKDILSRNNERFAQLIFNSSRFLTYTARLFVPYSCSTK